MAGPINSNVSNILNSLKGDNSGLIEEVVINKINSIKSRQMDVMFPKTTVPELNDFKKDENLIKLGNYEQTYTTAEDRIHLYKFADPLTLNFKLLIDYDKSSGLFAPEGKDAKGNEYNSALNYLDRIGENVRKKMLLNWINNFTALVKEFDFLFLDIDGLDIVQNKPNHEFFLGKEKIKITLRETMDMFVQSLITTLRHIVYDSIRKVTVLPANLMKFDCYVVVFSAGYYNMLFHEIDSNNPNNLDNMVLPTKKKLSDEIFGLDSIHNFTHVLYEFVGCAFDNESGSMFTENITNEMSSDYVKNNLTFTYKFANVSGTFNNITQNENWFSILARAAAENKLLNQSRMIVLNDTDATKILSKSNGSLSNLFSKENLDKALSKTVINKKILDNIKEFGDVNTYKNMYSSIKGKVIPMLEDKLINDLPMKLLGPNSIIGNNLSKLNTAELNNLVKNTTDLGISKVQDLYETGTTKVNNLIVQNYSDNLVDKYDSIFGGQLKNPIVVIEQPPKNKYTYNNDDSFNDTNYIRPDNLKYDDTIDDVKFQAGINGISFFPKIIDTADNKTKNNSITIRKGF